METQFIQIPRMFLNLDRNTKFIDILVYATIDFQKCNGTSRIGMRTIADKYNIPLSKVEDAVKRLKNDGYLDYTQIKSANNDYVFNEYTFPLLDKKCGYLKLKPSLLALPIKSKDRGMLIYLQLLAMPNMNQMPYSKIEDVAKELKITRQTTSKYLKMFLESGQISKSRYGYYVCQYLAKEDKEIKDSTNFVITL